MTLKVWTPLPNRGSISGSSVIDHVAGSPSELGGVMVGSVEWRLSSMNRFISVVAGSVVPLIVSWSSQLVMSAGSVIVGGQFKVILTDTTSDGSVSSSSIIAVTLKV